MNDNTATVAAPAEPAQKRRWRPRKAVSFSSRAGKVSAASMRMYVGTSQNCSS